MVKHRTAVAAAAIDAGMNYLDITTAAECLAYGEALQGRWEKMIIGADDHRLCPRNPANRTVKTRIQNVDECLRRLKTDYPDIWRVHLPGGRPSGRRSRRVDRGLQKMREAARPGTSSFGPRAALGIQHVVETFPEVEMVIFPHVCGPAKRPEDR